MKNLILLTTFFLISSIAFGQKADTETRKIDSFDKISVNSVIKVELYKGNTGEIEIYTENIPTEKIKSTVKNGKLTLNLESRKKGWNDIEVKVRVPFENLSKIIGSTASSISSDETLAFDNFEISLGEASQCDLNIECEALEVNLNSASKLHIAGKCQRLDANINSAATLNAFKLKVSDADIIANSMAKVRVNVKNDLHVTASSMSKVSYMGEPSNLHENKSSMASIRQVKGNMKEIK